MLNRYSIIFWDFDGVIKESNQVKTEAFVKLFQESSDGVLRKIRNHHIQNEGMSRFDKIPIYLKWSGIKVSEKNIEIFSKTFGNLVVQSVIDSPWVEGVQRYLELNSKKQKFVLVSATPKQELEYILKKLNIKVFFEKIYGAPDKKDIAINNFLKTVNVCLDDCIMIGDAMSDLNAANSNNIDFLLRKHKFNKTISKNFTGTYIEDFLLL